MKHEKYSCRKELGTEILMAITSSLIAFVVLVSADPILSATLLRGHLKKLHIFLSSTYALFLPLMSYMFAQVKQYYPEGRAQVILVWMVLMEYIRVHNERFPTWGLRKALEQMVRLSWVGFLIFGYAPPNGLRADLIVLCVYCAIIEVTKGYIFHKAKNSDLIEKNPTLIHNHVKSIMNQNDLHTTPMHNCDYIVMGEENHNITSCHNGYLLGERKSGRIRILTVGRVFQLNSPEHEAFTSTHPSWHDTCLALALAKMLRRRFANLPLDEDGCRKALDFVLEGLIDYIGTHKDITTNESSGEGNPIQRVFKIIKEELRFVSDFLNIEIPTYYYSDQWCESVLAYGLPIMFGSGIYIIYIVNKRILAWFSIGPQDANSYCFFNTSRLGPMVIRMLSRLDLAITIVLVLACIYIHYIEWNTFNRTNYQSRSWSYVSYVEKYIEDPVMWYSKRKKKNDVPNLTQNSAYIFYLSLKKSYGIYSSVLDMKGETVFCCIKVDWLFSRCCPKWIKRMFLRLGPTCDCSTTESLGAILRSLKNRGGHLTNGEASLKFHRMENLNYACKPNGSTTEVILVWHIATFLFHHQEPQNNTEMLTEKKVVLELSSYCCYLVARCPELLPDEVKWTTDMYESVIKEILVIDQELDQEPSRETRCNYALQVMNWEENSLLGKGVKLAKEMKDSARENAAPVWKMLADFWAEVMLYIAPSDNVEGHKKILHREELITQLWALLTHAGILRRPQLTEHHDDHESEINDVIGDAYV